MTTELTSTLSTLAWRIADDGIAAHDDAVAAAARAAGRAGAPVELVRLLLDRSQPAVARERAFGRLVGGSVAVSRAA